MSLGQRGAGEQSMNDWAPGNPGLAAAALYEVRRGDGPIALDGDRRGHKEARSQGGGCRYGAWKSHCLSPPRAVILGA